MQKGDKVEYRPVGGAQDNVSHSVGEIVDVHGSGAVRDNRMPSMLSNGLRVRFQDLRYSIKNNNTGKKTSYLVCRGGFSRWM